MNQKRQGAMYLPTAARRIRATRLKRRALALSHRHIRIQIHILNRI